MIKSSLWERFLSKRDKQVFAEAGYGVRGPFPSRPVLLLVDCYQGFLAGPGACPGAEIAMAIAARLADAARKRGLPIVHAGRHNHLAFNVGIDSPNVDETTGDFAWSLRPRLRDIIVRRQAPSAFFESDLMSFLNLLGADGIIVGGGTTAGAVRATVIDAFSLNLRTVVVADACFDFWEASHALTLFELDSKHSDVSVAKVVEARLRSFPEDLFALPAGEPTEYAR